MKVSQFAQNYPNYVFDFSAPIRDQKRIYDGAVLDQFPVELEPDEPYTPGGRGRPNRNQTLAHSQCATCQRVLRNDFFYTLPSMMKRNMVFSHCRECNQGKNAQRYDTRADAIRARRIVIWQYLAPRCASCGFDQHMSAMDMHHVENKDVEIANLITHVTLTLAVGRIEALLREAAKCVPLCSNCHRMLHAGAITLPTRADRPSYNIADLISRLKST
jgi:hypothetical protein